MHLDQKLRYLLLGFLIPMVLLVFITIGVLGYYSIRYNKLSHNEIVGSKFSISFKDDLDLEMYYISIASRAATELDEQLEKVDDAIELAKSLQKTTYLKESKKSLENILVYCNNLKKRMVELTEERNYDQRQIMLENNIRVLTGLIQTETQNYIYYEAGYLAKIEKSIMFSIRISILGLVLFSIIVTIVLLRRAFRFSEEISKPIGLICDNIKTVGDGNFYIEPVETYDYEVTVLNDGIQKMALRIKDLLEKEKQEQIRRHKTELQLIQAQINPHFLYNTLDTIVWLIEIGNQADAIKLITSLSEFFRTSLSKGKDIISLEEELSHTKSYLEIQQVRYGDIMDYRIDIPKSLWDLPIPKLTIQPLVENALYHGIKNMRKKGSIFIEGVDLGSDFIIRVGDDGKGMTKELLEEVKGSMKGERGTGFGIRAVHERIKLFCGEGYGIEISSKEGEGTLIEIIMLKKKKDFLSI